MIPNFHPAPNTMASADKQRELQNVTISPLRPVHQHQPKARRHSLRHQVVECTRQAVLHLTEKVSPITTCPLLRLLNDMSYQFLSTKESDPDIFQLLNDKSVDPHSTTNDHSIPTHDHKRRAIGEIGVSYLEMKSEKPPEHYSILSRSITGKSSGNLAKHGSRKTYLFTRNANENEKPITAICLIDTSNGEEV